MRDNVNQEELARGRTLPSSWYLDPRIHELEQRELFGRAWQHCGRLEQVARPGDYFAAAVGREPVLVTRDLDGTLRAMSNVCRHRAGPVARGSGNRRSLQCAYHGWTYRLDGALHTAAEFEGVEEFDRANCRLPAMRAGSWGPLLFVNPATSSHDGEPRAFDPASLSLDALLGDIPRETEPYGYAKMQFYKRHEWVVECNWKVYVDNYLEGYHIPFVHPGLFKEIDYDHYRVLVSDWYSRQDSPIRKTESVYRRNLGAEESPQALYYWIFPNLMLNLYPDNMQTNLIVPLGPERTLTIFEWYFADPGRAGLEQDFAQSFAFSESVQAEDIQICEDVQRGLRSATYARGRYSVKRENGVHHFHSLLQRILNPSVERLPAERS